MGNEKEEKTQEEDCDCGEEKAAYTLILKVGAQWREGLRTSMNIKPLIPQQEGKCSSTSKQLCILFWRGGGRRRRRREERGVRVNNTAAAAAAADAKRGKN